MLSEAQLATWLRLVIRTTALDLLRGETRRQRRQAAAVPIGFREEHFGRAVANWEKLAAAEARPADRQNLALWLYNRGGNLMFDGKVYPAYEFGLEVRSPPIAGID